MDRPLTDLEAAALGWIRSHEPATPYAVRVHFEASPAARFSGSAGAIYPMMRRLEREGLLASEAFAQGRRRARAYRLTRAGLTAFKRWLRGPLEPRAMMTVDPLRTRAIYLRHLSPLQRRRWLEEAERSLVAQARLVEEYAAEGGDDPFLALAHDNARRELEARRAWLADARRRLG